MPAAAEEAINYEDGTHTRKLSLNLEKIREFGVAMAFGSGEQSSEHEECNTSLIVNSGCGQSNELASWISQDVKNNTKLLKILTTEIAMDSDMDNSDYVFNSGRISEYSKESFNDDITSMLASIRERLPLSSEESTISLAKRVAAMEDDSMDSDENIERWAHKLANDISKGND